MHCEATQVTTPKGTEQLLPREPLREKWDKFGTHENDG